jgi:undecaprenyl-diphosphatase
VTLRSRLDASWASPRQTGVRVALVAVVLAVAAVPFLLLLLFVESRWGPLLELDNGARDGLHSYALAHPTFVTIMRVISNSGSGPAWMGVTIALALVVLVRRQIRLALFVLVTNAGSSLLNGFVKTAVNRARPVVNHPLLHEPGMSFPSGHAQAAVAGYGVLLFVVLPYVRGVWRRVVLLVAVLMVLAIGFSRIALAVHYVSDVLAAYVLGLAWLVAMASVFHVWRRTETRAAQ